MEKIIYLIGAQKSDSSIDQLKSVISGPVSKAVVAAGGQIATLHVADLNDWIRAECPSRQFGDVDSITAVLSLWLPSCHLAEPVTESMQSVCSKLHAILVTEAVWQEDRTPFQGGESRPGITFISCIKRNAALDKEAFFSHWDEHSVDSVALHPLRQAYTRHTVVRPLTHNAPELDGIVFEHFPSREVFADDALFFDVNVAQRTTEHTLQMIDLENLTSNGFSQYRYADAR